MRPRTIQFFGLAILLFSLSVDPGIDSTNHPVTAHELPARPADEQEPAKVHAVIRNVDMHITDRIVVHINSLQGMLVPTQQNEIPNFDNKNSFAFDVQSASLFLSTTALSSDLNDYVFVHPGAPLKKLEASVKDNELVVKGLLVSKGGIPFESDGTVSLTPDGQIRIHTDKVKAAGIPVKGLMDILGLETSKLISTKKVNGVSVDKDDLILNPEEILPPPAIHGTLTGIQVRPRGVELKFGNGEAAGAEKSNPCGGRNFIALKGGSIRFGKLTMSDADVELVDSDPGSVFDFSLDHYNEQLVAGYAKSTAQQGLCVHLPDFERLRQNRNPGTKQSATAMKRNAANP